MRYRRILAWAASEPWAIDPIKGRALLEILELRARGERLSPEERQAAIDGRRANSIARREGAVAVIPIFGVMMQRADMFDEISGAISVERIGRALNAALSDTKVKAIVLQIDSPGGGIYGVRELAQKIFDARGEKPVIAQVDSVAASAAYWVASQAEDMAVTPGGDVGSIGVYTVHEDISRLLEDMGVVETVISAGKYKTELNPFQPLSEEARDYLQARVDDAHGWFVGDVARGRGVDRKVVERDFGQGRLLSAQDAIKVGMADRVATLEDTIRRYTANQGTGRQASRVERERLALAERI